MKNFKVVKRGYDIDEVDDYILSLELENSNIIKEKQSRIDELRLENFELTNKLNEFKNKEENISKALLVATTKAQEIEDLSKNKYQTEINSLKEFYNKWDNFFNELLRRYPKMEDFDTNKVLKNIQDDINNLLKTDYLIEDSNLEKHEAKEILQKLKTSKKPNKKVTLKINKKIDENKIIDSENNIEFMLEHNKVNNIKPITKLTLTEEEKEEFDSLLDKFLHTDNNVSKGYEKSILNKNKKKVLKSKIEIPVNESGFDFNEALNPTDNLTDIMKGFKLD